VPKGGHDFQVDYRVNPNAQEWIRRPGCRLGIAMGVGGTRMPALKQMILKHFIIPFEGRATKHEE
jgi:hypothetical protein